MAKRENLNRDSHIPDGEVLVRVGAGVIDCPNGRDNGILPTITLVWPESEENPWPRTALAIRWVSKPTSTKNTKLNPKYINLYDPTTDIGWLHYRVDATDRARFETLREKWGMWFLKVVRQGEEGSRWYAYFSDGGFPFHGDLPAQMDDLVLLGSEQMKLRVNEMLASMLDGEDGSVARDITKKLGADLNDYRTLINNIPSVLEDVGGGPLPWIPRELPHWGKPGRDEHEYIVEQYLTLLSQIKGICDGSTQQADGYGDLDDEQVERHKIVLQAMRTARIFEISPDSYKELHAEIDRYCTEEVAQLTYHPPGGEVVDVPDEETVLLYERQKKACLLLPFPRNLPFESCWFAIGGITAMSQNQQEARGLQNEGFLYSTAGYLATRKGELFELILRRDPYTRDILGFLCLPHKRGPEGDWLSPLCLVPFIFERMVFCINEHSTFVLGSRRVGIRNKGKLAKALRTKHNRKPAPPTFYTVYLKDVVIHETIKVHGLGLPKSVYGHRFDVRGHWHGKLYRGQLPLPPEEELSYERRNYTVYKTKELDQWAIDELIRKNQPMKRSGEWIAIKRKWVTDFIKPNNDNLPYVPSNRKATKGILSD
jgi:hypothetical protein